MSKNNSEVNIKRPSEKHKTRKSSEKRKSKKSSLELQVNKSRKTFRQESDEESADTSEESENPATTKELVGFWLLGLCCHFGYNVLLSAAHDLVDSNMSLHSQADAVKPDKAERQVNNNFKRPCNEDSTGSLLLINVGPEILAQIIGTFSPFYLNSRMILIVLISFCGIITCASSTNTFFFYLGVGITSFSNGLAECTLLSYLSIYDNNKLVLTVSSASGFSGLFGSLWYVSSVALGFTSSTILYTLTFIPVLTAIAFWGILNPPIFCTDKSGINPVNRPSYGRKNNFWLNIAYIPHLYPFMIALSLVYFFEYYINSTLHELMYFKNFTLTPRQQYRWYQVTYNVGAFLVKNSLSFITVESLWCFPLLQGINATFLTFAAIYLLIPHFTFVLCFIFWEGLMGGYTYTTIFYTLYDQVEPDRRRFSMGFVTIAEILGIFVAGLISQPAHTFICGLPETMSVWTTY